MSDVCNFNFLSRGISFDYFDSLIYICDSNNDITDKLKLIVDDDIIEMKNGRRCFIGDKKNVMTKWTLEYTHCILEKDEYIYMFKIENDNINITFDLHKLTYIGVDLPDGVCNMFILNNTNSGYFCRNEDLTERAFKSIRIKIKNCRFFDEKLFNELVNTNEDLNKLESEIKDDRFYQLKTLNDTFNEVLNNVYKSKEALSIFQQGQETRLSHIMHESHESEVNQIINKNKETYEENKFRSNNEKQKELLKTKIDALRELNIIFTYVKMDSPDHRILCGVMHTRNPANVEQFNKNRFFLGFLTHYIREVSRVLGIVLDYTLYPSSANSEIHSRERIRTVYKIPAAISGKQSMLTYECILVKCINKIKKALTVDRDSDIYGNIDSESDIYSAVDSLFSLVDDEKTLEALLPGEVPETYL